MEGMRPLSELHRDIDACKKILESIRWGEFTHVQRHEGNGPKTHLFGRHYEGYWINLIICDSGNILFVVNGEDDDFGSAFALVDFIRSLGYDAI